MASSERAGEAARAGMTRRGVIRAAGGGALAIGTKQLPDDIVGYYVEILASQPDALRGSFGWYRELDTTTAQNARRATQPLTIPVLGVGGAESLGDAPASTMKLIAGNVQTLVLPGCGHWVAEQAPTDLLAGLAAFLDS